MFSAITSHRHVLERKDDTKTNAQRKVHIPNPLASLTLLFSRGNASAIFMSAITYAVKMTVQASLGAQCIEIYDLSYLQAGLVYLPAGISSAMGAKIGGLLIDRNYRRMCAKFDGSSFQRGENISDFPIEKARLIGAHAMTWITAVGTVGYGLALMMRAVSDISAAHRVAPWRTTAD
jgi:hypothetical protein